MDRGEEKRRYLTVAAFAVLFVISVGISICKQPQTISEGNSSAETDFHAFMGRYQKKYSLEEFETRRKLYEDNVEFVRRFNEGSQGVKLRENWMADLSDEEYRQLLMEPDDPSSAPSQSTPPVASSLPLSLDWTQLGAVTPVKDQKSCGSCYAFSVTGAIESAYYLHSSVLVPLSEQELVDCSKTYGNRGCHGGKITNAFRYAVRYGLMTGEEYPYVKYDHDCFALDSAERVFISDFITVPKYDQLQLKVAVARQPVAVALQADQKLFQFYQTGVVGMECGSRLSHAALLVGYGATPDGTDFWLVKNSWGTGWGEHGFIRLLRNDEGKDEGPCGITLDASYPVIQIEG